MRAERSNPNGSPFKCEECNDKDKENRNCLNRKGLTEDGRAITEYTEEIKQEFEEKRAGKVFSLGNIRLYECPLSYISEETGEIMRLCFLMEETGNLLYEGGWGNQPIWLVEAFEVYKAEITRHLEKTRNA